MCVRCALIVDMSVKSGGDLGSAYKVFEKTAGEI